MIIVEEIKQTCWACPSQWEGKTTKDEYIYVRYRWGYLSVSIDGEKIFGVSLGDSLDGILSYEDLKEATADKILFPPSES